MVTMLTMSRYTGNNLQCLQRLGTMVTIYNAFSHRIRLIDLGLVHASHIQIHKLRIKYRPATRLQCALRAAQGRNQAFLYGSYVPQDVTPTGWPHPFEACVVVP